MVSIYNIHRCARSLGTNFVKLAQLPFIIKKKNRLDLDSLMSHPTSIVQPPLSPNAGKSTLSHQLFTSLLLFVSPFE